METAVFQTYFPWSLPFQFLSGLILLKHQRAEDTEEIIRESGFRCVFSGYNIHTADFLPVEAVYNLPKDCSFFNRRRNRLIQNSFFFNAVQIGAFCIQIGKRIPIFQTDLIQDSTLYFCFRKRIRIFICIDLTFPETIIQN